MQVQDPALLGLHNIHNHFLAISDLELDLMPVNQFSIHSVSAVSAVYSLLSKTFYGNELDALEKFKYVTVSLLPSQPNFNLPSVKHCVRYKLPCSIPYYDLHHLLHDPSWIQGQMACPVHSLQLLSYTQTKIVSFKLRSKIFWNINYSEFPRLLFENSLMLL